MQYISSLTVRLGASYSRPLGVMPRGHFLMLFVIFFHHIKVCTCVINVFESFTFAYLKACFYSALKIAVIVNHDAKKNK